MTTTMGPFVTGILASFVKDFGDTEITGQQMLELFGGGPATTVKELDQVQLVQFAFASALRNNAALMAEERRERLIRGMAPFMNRQPRRHGR